MVVICKKSLPMTPFYKVILLFLASSSVLGQNFFEKIKYQAESGIYLSTSGKTPFLIRSNQYGTVPLENPIFTLRGSAFKEYDSTYNSDNRLNRLSVGYGINAVANIGKTNQVILPEAYVKLRYGAFEFYAGRRREIVGLVDTTLTSGSYIWSGNALPLPKIQIAIPNYTPILGKGLLSIKGAYSHGWFDNGAVKNFYLHQKYLYARIGKPNWKVKLYSGFNHQVQWGGKPAVPYIDKTTGMLISKFASNFNNYLRIIAGISLNKNGTGLSTGSPKNEALNRAGNHLGTIDIATEVNFKNCDVFLYRQNIYDDGSLFYLNNIMDGLTGISFRRKNIRRGIVGICLEYLYTMNQGGNREERYDDIPQLRGVDNYFNNSIYSDGWVYKDNVIGTPLLVSLNLLNFNILDDKSLKQYSSSYILNRVEAFSLAVNGKGQNVEYHVQLLINHNLGSYFLPINKTEFAILYKFNYKLPKFNIITHASFNNGKLFSNSIGGYLGIQRVFF